MAKLSAEQQRQLKELEDLRDAEDTSEELTVWVRKGDHETRLTGERARRWLKANGYDEDDAEDASKAEPLEEKAEPVKKATPAKVEKVEKAESADVDAGDLEQDAPAVTRPRVFF